MRADPNPSNLSRRQFLRRTGMTATGVIGLGALSPLLKGRGSGLPAGLGADLAAPGAKAKGELNVIALPPDWSNYGTIITTFQKKYGIKVNSTAPDDSSAQELAAIKALRGQSRGPDAVDVSPSIAEVGLQERLFRPYKVSTWDTVPTDMKDPDGYWTGDYYGAISFGVNTKVVKNPPMDWSDLSKPEYKGMVSINGDPRSAGDAFAAVYAAALANGGSLDDIEPGIEFFVKLKKDGTWTSTNCLPANIQKGTTPIAIEWDYLNIAYDKQFDGAPRIDTVIPATGRFGNFYCQAISAYAPNFEVAKLWEEFLYSDEGQLLYLAGFAHPARYDDLASKGLIPPSLAKLLPPASEYKGIVFPNVAQTDKAASVLAAKWGPLMG